MVDQLQHTDYILVSDTGKEYPCNKTVLAFHSNVFKANFEMKDSKEVQEGQMKIPDISDKSLEIMVTFLYTHDINDEDVCTNCIDLLVLADQYDIETLRKIGVPKIIQKIDQDNCLDVFICAKLHKYEDVEIEAFEVIFTNMEFLLERSRLKNLIKEYPEEMANLMFKVNEKHWVCKKLANNHNCRHCPCHCPGIF